MALFYQIDCSVGSSGKRVSVTKRRVRWRWGIVNEDTLASDATGVQCRGYEHEVALTWSLTSGKRLVLLDGEEVHYSTGRRTEGKFQYSWTSSGLGNHVFTVIAFAVTPIMSTPSFKQFDFLINGQSYSDFHDINELGAPKDHTKNHIIDVPTNTREQEMQWAHQVIKLEQKREMNEVGPTTPRHSPSILAGKKGEMNRVLSPRTKRVTFSCDIVSEDLLSAALPVQTNHYVTASDDEFNPDKPQSNDTIWSTIMDAYDSGIATQADIESCASKENPVPYHQTQPNCIHGGRENLQIQTGGIHNNIGIFRVQNENAHYDSMNLQVHAKNVHNGAGMSSSSM